jgi:sterol desaturase/sphingolipid hydroxylase (fatty acid hydroxylase superfamily)
MGVRSKLTSWIAAPAALAAFALLVFFERRHPLRRAAEPKLRRQARNLAIAVLGAVTLQCAEAPVALRLTRIAEDRGWGLLQLIRGPRWLNVLLAVALMDYTMYVWHILLHQMPLLWRFHLAHHTDLDLDVSTALRFHFGELLLSVPWRAAQIVLIGVSPFAFSSWQTLFLLSIMFHHSEVELPFHIEKRLVWFIVTPRMHGIHHSIVRRETNSNWSSGLTLWDRLHGTLRLNVPQSDVIIGVPAYRHPEQVTLLKTIRLPFEQIPEVWNLPGAGEPVRAEIPTPASHLLP